MTQSFYFWVSSAAQFGIVFKSSMAGSPCAVQSIQVERLDANSGLPQPPDESRKPNRRKMGIFAEDPILSTAYGNHPIADLQRLGLDNTLTPIESGQTLTLTLAPYELQAWKLTAP